MCQILVLARLYTKSQIPGCVKKQAAFQNKLRLHARQILKQLDKLDKLGLLENSSEKS